MNNEVLSKNVILLPLGNILLVNVSSTRFVDQGLSSVFCFFIFLGYPECCSNWKLLDFGWPWYRNSQDEIIIEISCSQTE